MGQSQSVFRLGRSEVRSHLVEHGTRIVTPTHNTQSVTHAVPGRSDQGVRQAGVQLHHTELTTIS